MVLEECAFGIAGMTRTLFQHSTIFRCVLMGIDYTRDSTLRIPPALQRICAFCMASHAIGYSPQGHLDTGQGSRGPICHLAPDLVVDPDRRCPS